MPEERTVTLPRPWADNASTNIPSPPIPGQSYRDSGLNVDAIAKGQNYATLLDSSEYNEILYRMSLMLGLLEQNGILPWSSNTNYDAGSWVMGMDSIIYKALRPSGPDNGGAVPPPNINSWSTTLNILNLSDLGATTGILPAVRSGFTQGIANNGWCRLPNGLIFQWGAGSTTDTTTTGTYITLPITFPDTGLSVVAGDTGSGTHIVAAGFANSSQIRVWSKDYSGNYTSGTVFYWLAFGR